MINNFIGGGHQTPKDRMGRTLFAQFSKEFLPGHARSYRSVLCII